MSISALDFVLLQLGTPGYYLIFLGFLICCLQLPIVFTEYIFKYYIFEPPHRCKVSPQHHLYKDLNVHKNEWFPLVKVEKSNQYSTSSTIDQLFMLNTNTSQQMFDQCNMYIDPIHHWKGVQPCQNGWEYWFPNNQQNLITEFNLVCENKFLLTILTNVICISALVGAFLFGIMCDKFGRRRTLNITIYLFVASALSVYFVADFLQFSIFYNLQIFFVKGLQISAYVTLLEIFPTPYQLKANFLWFAFQSLVSILISVLICTIHDWRYMQLSIAVPSFAFITYLFVLPSSPLWQTVVKRNQQAAVKTLIHFSKFSGQPISINQLRIHIQNLYTSTITFVSQVFEPIVSNGSAPTSIQPQHQFVNNLPSLSKPGPILRWYLLTNFYLFFVLTILNSELFDQLTLSLNHNQNVDSIYNTLIDLAFIILSYHLSLWFGSRIIQSLLFFANGVLIIASLVLKEYLKNKSSVDIHSFDFRLLLVPPILIVIARSIGRLILIFVSFHAVKSIPTNIRATGLGCCFFWIQLARLSVPHLLVLSSYLPFNTLHCMFGILSIFSGAMSLLFPHLERKPWPNTLMDLEERNNGYNNSSMSSTSSTKRYPSYRDMKTYTKNRSASVQDIYSISPNGEHFSNQTMREARIGSDLHFKNNSPEILMVMHGGHQNSFSSASAKPETERTSVSSGGGVNEQPFESPSDSFTAQIINHNPKPTYIPYNDLDPFSTEWDQKVNLENRSQNNEDPTESSSIHV